MTAPEREQACNAPGLLTPEETAAVLRVSLRWVYRHWKALPFARKLGPKVLRFDRAGLDRWVMSKRP